MKPSLLELAERYQQHAIRVAKLAISPIGVSRADAATAADCFAIAAALRASNTKEEK
jgi:hypothetical protein